MFKDEYGRYFLEKKDLDSFSSYDGFPHLDSFAVYPKSEDSQKSCCYEPCCGSKVTREVIDVSLNNIKVVTDVALKCEDKWEQDDILSLLDDLVTATYNYSRTRFTDEEEE